MPLIKEEEARSIKKMQCLLEQGANVNQKDEVYIIHPSEYMYLQYMYNTSLMSIIPVNTCVNRSDFCVK